MVASAQVIQRSNVIGSLWMLASMGAFAIEASFFTAAPVTVPVAQTLTWFAAGTALIFAGLACLKTEPLYTSAGFHTPTRFSPSFDIPG